MFEGFKPNGLQIRNQRNDLHILALVNIDFEEFSDFCIFCNLLASVALNNNYSKDFETLESI